MRLKSYFAATVEAGLAQAARDLGEEAMLVYSREATPETRYLGRYEVVVATREALGLDAGPEREWPPVPASVRKQDEQRAFEALHSRLAELESRIERWSGPMRDRPERGSLAAESAETSHTASERGPRILVLVGPAGSGKTLCAGQLAADCRLRRQAAGGSVSMVSLDNRSLGGAERLRRLAEILGADFERFPTAERLVAWLGSRSRTADETILVDTVACGPSDSTAADEITRLRETLPAAEFLPVLAASMRPDTQLRLLRQYSVWGPRRLVFTRLDEMDETESLARATAEAGLAAAFFCSGTRIPDDFHSELPRRARASGAAVGGDWAGGGPSRRE
jgi:flagellar biosynthesis GTPase FlhF